jgi:hypothetical protein
MKGETPVKLKLERGNRREHLLSKMLHHLHRVVFQTMPNPGLQEVDLSKLPSLETIMRKK